MLRRFAFLLLLGLLVGAAPCAAQEKGPTNPAGKESSKKPAAGGEMDVKPAPTTGTMPGRQTPAPKGRLGSEPVRKDKLGTPPPENSKDRPPRPQ